MNYDTRSNLINALTDEFKGMGDDLKIDTSNFINTTGTMDCSAMGLDEDTLNKTKRVIEQQIDRFLKKNNNDMNTQYILHLKVAKKCVEEIIQLKNKG